jgi:hypothetical protein
MEHVVTHRDGVATGTDNDGSWEAASQSWG